jgi:hypothetical protein
MEMKTVESSNLKEVGYDKKTKKLRVTFHNGGSYTYSGVPETTHNELINAPSIGEYFTKNIRTKFRNEKS